LGELQKTGVALKAKQNSKNKEVLIVR
jgi:hypothetical protein